jgi:hypothetical protein
VLPFDFDEHEEENFFEEEDDDHHHPTEEEEESFALFCPSNSEGVVEKIG